MGAKFVPGGYHEPSTNSWYSTDPMHTMYTSENVYWNNPIAVKFMAKSFNDELEKYYDEITQSPQPSCVKCHYFKTYLAKGHEERNEELNEDPNNS